MTDTDELAGRLDFTNLRSIALDGDHMSDDAAKLLAAFVDAVEAALRALRAERDEARAEAHDAKVEMLKEWDRHLGTKLDLAKQAAEAKGLREALKDAEQIAWQLATKAVVCDGPRTMARLIAAEINKRARALAQGEKT